MKKYIIALSLCLPSLLLGQDKAPERKKDESSTLRFEGKPGLRFEGLCVSPDGTHQQKIAGQVPSEVQLDYRIHSCKVKGAQKTDKGIKVRVFHDRKMVFEKADIPPTAGIELVIPFGKKK